MAKLEARKVLMKKLLVRSSDDARFLSRMYSLAMNRVKYQELGGGYWYAPTEEASVSNGKILLLGGLENSIDETREKAFEMLVLADLAELENETKKEES